MKQIEASDVLIFSGLSLMGIGLFFWLGLGVSLTAVGAVLVCMGFFGGAAKVKK